MNNRVREIIERLRATTPGAWKAFYPSEDDFSVDVCIYSENGQYVAQTSYDGGSDSYRSTMKADAEFISHAKEDILYLLSLIQK